MDALEPEVGHRVERVPFRVVRWSWDYQHADGSCSGGWTATKRGARREVAKAARRDWDATGPHAPLTVGWPNR